LLKLTAFDNGVIIDVDKKKVTSFGPHKDGGSFVQVNGLTYHVQETLEEITKAE
jgi:hypothetical protein